MKRSAILLTFLLCSSLPSFGQESVNKALDNFPVWENEAKTPILILGSFHFNFSENISDVKGEYNFVVYADARWEELLALIEKIKKFKPTKIAVEMMVTSQPTMDSLAKHIPQAIGKK
jgi:hypothetical protein